MKRRTKLILILSAVFLLVAILLTTHLRVRGQFTDYLLKRYPSENFSIDYISYGLVPRQATAQVRTASDKMPFEVNGRFQGTSIRMDLTDNYYVSRSEVYFKERLDPIIESYGDAIYDYELTIRQDMAPIQAGTIPIYPFELHVVLGEGIVTPDAYASKVANIAEELVKQNVAGMEILHFVSVPIRPTQSTLKPYGLDIGLLKPVPQPTEEPTPTPLAETTEPTDPSESETTTTVSVEKKFLVESDMMLEIFLDKKDQPFTEGIIQNGMRLVTVNRQRLSKLGLANLPQAQGQTSSSTEVTASTVDE